MIRVDVVYMVMFTHLQNNFFKKQLQMSFNVKMVVRHHRDSPEETESRGNKPGQPTHLVRDTGGDVGMATRAHHGNRALTESRLEGLGNHHRTWNGAGH